ncbi:MAG: DUF6106 family protein [Eubacteriales bacterium]|nr:DUF6106 family protein [Eubacteriales bacterium]
MNDSYCEVLVKREHRSTDTLIKIGMCAVTVLMFLAGLIVNSLLWILAIAMVAACYFIFPRTDVEYEYLFVNGELDIDAIFSKAKRKKVISLSMNDVEIVALTTGHRLDYYHNNPKIKVKDFSSGNNEHKRISLIVRSKEEINEVILEADEYLCELMKKNSPSKVFLND